MYCPNCGKQLPNESVACSYCATVFNVNNSDMPHQHNQCSENCNNCSATTHQPHNTYNQQNYAYSPQPQFLDAGHGYALACMLCGILSLFVGGIFCAIASLILANSYSKIGNGANADKVKTGKICSWICIGLTAGVIVFYILAFSVLLISGMA